MPSSDTPAPTSRRSLALVFLVSFLVVFGVLSACSALYDGDSYFHLAAARRYRQGEIRGGLEWARFSVMSQGFGDKELLFHFVVAPFTLLPGSVGGKLALAALNAGLATMFAWLAVRAIGPLGYLVPFWCLLGSTSYLERLLRLRPELLSLLLLLWATHLAVTRRYRLLGAAAVLLTLSHTGFGILLILCLAWLLWVRHEDGRWRWELLAYPVLGTAVALVLHPQFPANLRVFLYQNLLRFRYRLPDAGQEFTMISLADAVIFNAGWLLGLFLLWRARAPAARGDDRSPATVFFAIGSAAFGLLFLWLARFATYLVPFGTLAVLYGLRRPGLRLADLAPTSRAARILVPIGVAAIALASGNAQLDLYRHLRRQGVIGSSFEADLRSFAAAVPEGAKVAATWQDAEVFSFWAPSARYLNVLDPIFMAAFRPAAYRSLLSIFDGSEPDIPLRADLDLDSDYLAAGYPGSLILRRRLDQDPRARVRHLGRQVLYELQSNANGGFVLDWRVAPSAATPPPRDPEALAGWPSYPRHATARGRAMEGFVDAARVAQGGGGCAVLAHVTRPATASRLELELAAYGPTTLWVDGAHQVTQGDTEYAVLGRGLILTIELAPGEHVLTVKTCGVGGHAGFFLLERGPRSETRAE